MAFQTWQVGLDIQNGQLCALAVQRRRNGWQLRHWWQHALPQDTLRNGLMQRPDIVIALLSQWRKKLPVRISLRVGFPPQLVMQRSLRLPAQQLREPDRVRYLSAASRQLFPIEPEALALDYREAHSGGALILTATRREALHNWLNCLQQAGLEPQVLELTSGALSVLAAALGMAATTTLVHCPGDHWLWYSPQRDGQPWGWCERKGVPDLSALRQQHLAEIDNIICSLPPGETLPADVSPLLPLRAVQFVQPPLPVNAGAFTLALGLALRAEDC